MMRSCVKSSSFQSGPVFEFRTTLWSICPARARKLSLRPHLVCNVWRALAGSCVCLSTFSGSSRSALGFWEPLPAWLLLAAPSPVHEELETSNSEALLGLSSVHTSSVPVPCAVAVLHQPISSGPLGWGWGVRGREALPLRRHKNSWEFKST